MGKVEEVARAIEDNIKAALPDAAVVDYRYAARAALEAMREPSFAMRMAGLKRDTGSPLVTEGDIFRAMIDAAISEDKEQG
jgi:hypothetical protein